MSLPCLTSVFCHSTHQILEILVLFVLTRSAQNVCNIVVVCIWLEKNDVYAENGVI